jgi:hypothetical protein
MTKQALVSTNNLKHNVAALMVRAQKSLTDLARVYFLTEVAGQARATLEAKKRDLARLAAKANKADRDSVCFQVSVLFKR